MAVFTFKGSTLTIQVLLLLCLSSLTNPAFANACKDDIKTLCKAERGDRKAIVECLESNKSDLSSECAEQLDKMAQREKSDDKSKGNACRDSIQEFCSDVRADGRDAVLACLETNKSELSSECAEQLDRTPAE